MFSVKMILSSILMLLYWSSVHAVDISRCVDSTQCMPDYFCDPPGVCSPCLKCEELKREPGGEYETCAESVSSCGPCLPGLVEDPSGNVHAKCVLPSLINSPSEGPPTYLYITLFVVLLLFMLIIIIVIYVLRNTETLKILSSIRTSVRAPHTMTDVVRIDQHLPPPYAPEYQPVRPTSPSLNETDPSRPNSTDGSNQLPTPLVKQSDWHHVRSARERDANQEARVFNNPNYIRGPELPPSYDAALNEPSLPDVNDDNTMESIWTPTPETPTPQINAPSSEAAGVAPSGELSTLLHEARGTTIVRKPSDRSDDEAAPQKMLCVRQDSTNGGSRRARPEGESSTSHPVLTFNINVQQHSDMKLIRT